MENHNMTGGDDQMPMNMNMNMSDHGGGGGMSMMHMTFYWGKNSAILFKGWPGTSTGMYVLALIVVFALAVLVEWLGHCRVARDAAGLVRTALHTVRVGVAYVVMLALMSFNVGVFIVAVVGHGVGFLLFGTSVFWPADEPVSADDAAKARLPPSVHC